MVEMGHLRIGVRRVEDFDRSPDGERAQPHPFGGPRLSSADERLAKPAGCLARPVGDDEEEGNVEGVLDEVLDQFGGHGVGPVKVIDEENEPLARAVHQEVPR